MSNNQGYNPYNTGMPPVSSWQQSNSLIPPNPGMQNWTQPVASTSAPTFGSAPNNGGRQPESGWQQQSGWHKGGSLHGEQSGPYYAPAQTSQNYSGGGQEDFSQDYYKQNSNNVFYQPADSRFPAPSDPRLSCKQEPVQAQVFRTANQQIMSRMISGGRGRGRGGVRGGMGQQSPRQKAPVKPTISPMEQLQSKNLAGLKWDNRVVTGKTTIYITLITYRERQFVGTGRAKLDANNDAAKYLLLDLGETVSYVPDVQPSNNSIIPELYQLLQKKQCTEKLEFTYTGTLSPFTCYCTLGGATFTGLGNSKKVAKGYTAQRVLDAINAELIDVITSTSESGEETAATPRLSNPLAALNLKITAAGINGLEWHMDSFKSNADNAVLHTAAVNFFDQQFIGQDSNKKGAKTNVASQILQAIESGSIVLPSKSLKRPSNKGGEDEDANMEPARKQAKADPASANALSRVNQMFPGCISWTFDQSGPPHAPTYTAYTLLQNRTFSAAASSKKDAKMAVAVLILNDLANGIITAPPTKVKTPSKPKDNPQPMEETEATSSSAEGESANAAQGQSSDEKSKEVSEGENPISKVTRLFGSLAWETEFVGAVHQPLFQAKTTIQDQEFSGQGSTKKEAKLKSCLDILAAVEAGKLIQPDKVQSPQAEVANFWPRLTWVYRIESTVHSSNCYASTAISGITFRGSGNTKKLAKLDVCQKIMSAVTKGILAKPKPSQRVDAHDVAKFNKWFGNPELLVQEGGTEETPEFTCTTTVDNQLFTGSGDTSDKASAQAINAVFLALRSGDIEPPVLVQFQRKFKRNRMAIENIGTETMPVYRASYTHHGVTYSSTSVGSSDQAEREVAEKVLEAPTNKAAKPGEVTPASILNQKTNGEVKISVERLGLAQPNDPFIAKAIVEGREYQGSGRSKIQAKQNCAAVILVEVYGHKFDLGNFDTPSAAGPTPDMVRGDIGSLDHQALSTKVQGLVSQKYADVVMALEKRFQSRKVIAGCVMTRGDDVNTAEVLTFASGTKCIPGGSMSATGVVINDHHAEILVRRALKRYLYKQVELAQTSGSSILVPTGNDTSGVRYKLADGVKFHLYISSPPCGDSRVFTSSTVKEGEKSNEIADANPNRANRGQLRGKMESGQGTLPVTADDVIKEQSWDGIMAGDRYINMSCCDKVARWALLGFQGSLLSTIIQPIYFSSVVVASMFNQSHIYRGLYGRFHDLEVIGQITAPYRHHSPEIIGTVIAEPRDTNKPPVFSLVWQALDNVTELLDTKTGLFFDNSYSTLCKKMLFRLYRNVNAGVNVPEVYEQAKATATQYQALKDKLYLDIEAQGLGKWVRKPVQQDQFVDGPDVVLPTTSAAQPETGSLPEGAAPANPGDGSGQTPVVDPSADIKPVVDPSADIKPVVDPSADITPVVDPSADITPVVDPSADIKPVVDPSADIKPVKATPDTPSAASTATAAESTTSTAASNAANVMVDTPAETAATETPVTPPPAATSSPRGRGRGRRGRGVWKSPK